MSICTGIAANPDVSGIGIRINLYLTALILVLIPSEPSSSSTYDNSKVPERPKSNSEILREVTSGAAAISGLSLLIAAVVQTANGQLSLYHAIFVIHALYFTGIIVVPTGDYGAINFKAQLIRILLALVMIYGSMMMFIGYGLYLWAKIPTFGNTPQCNDKIKYVFFFHSVSPTTPWLRGLWMTTLATFGIMVISVLMATFFMPSLKKQLPEWKSKVDNLKFFRLLGVIYGVVMLELYVRRNGHLISAGEQQWTFGQVMAIVQMFGVLNELLHYVMSSVSNSETR